MKYKEPTLGKGIRTLFRKNKYKVFLVDEHKTSVVNAPSVKEEFVRNLW
jgi:hypothetical protein